MPSTAQYENNKVLGKNRNQGFIKPHKILVYTNFNITDSEPFLAEAALGISVHGFNLSNGKPFLFSIWVFKTWQVPRVINTPGDPTQQKDLVTCPQWARNEFKFFEE